MVPGFRLAGDPRDTWIAQRVSARFGDPDGSIEERDIMRREVFVIE